MSERKQDSRAGGMMITGGEGVPCRSLAIARSLFRIHCVGIFTRRFCQLNFPYETKDMGMKMIGRATADKNRTRDKTTSETNGVSEERNAGATRTAERTTKRKTATKSETARRDEERNDKKRNERQNDERDEGRDAGNRHDMRRHATRRFCQLNLVIR